MISLAQVQARIRTHNNLLVVVADAFLGGLQNSMIGVVWQPFVLSLGASMSVLGLLTSLAGGGGIIPTLVSPAGGWLADRRGRKLVLLGGGLFIVGGLVFYTVAGYSGVALAILPGVILLGLANIARPANSALVGESVGEGRRGTAYSLVLFAGVVPGILAPLAAGWLADRYGYAIVFPIVLAVEVVAVGIIARYLNDTHPRAQALDWRELGQSFRHALLPMRQLRAISFASALDVFSWGMGWGLLYGLLTKTYGYTATQLGILSSIMSLTWAITQLPIGRLIDRRGSRISLLVSEALGPPLMLIWMTQGRFEIIAASMTLFAITAALWIPARSTYITHVVEPERRAEAFGRLTAFIGIVAFPAPFIGGYLYDNFGFAAPLFANLVGSAITTLLIWIFLKEPKRIAHAPTEIGAA